MKAFLFTLLFVYAPMVHAQLSGISYPHRDFPYQAWSTIVRGDNNTIGMAGAITALPTSISAMESNPAGFAMYLGGIAAQINSNSLKDPEMNRSATSITEYQ